MSKVVTIKYVHASDKEMCYFRDVNDEHFHLALLVSINDSVSGGLCIYQNHQVKHKGKSCLLIGNLTIINDDSLMDTLISEVEKIAGQLGAQVIVGPINGSTWDNYRLSVNQSEQVFSGDIAQPLYYHRLFLKSGFSVMHKYYSARSTVNKHHDVNTAELAKQGVRIRGISKEHFENELRLIYKLCKEAFAGNELFSEVSEAGFVSRLIRFQPLINPKYALVAEDDKGIVALFFGYQGKWGNEDAVILKTIARHPQRLYKLLVETMAKVWYNNASDEHIQWAIHAFMHERNKSLDWSQRYGGIVVNEYAVYMKEL